MCIHVHTQKKITHKHLFSHTSSPMHTPSHTLTYPHTQGIDVKSMGRIFIGLVKCGAWGCFDEFNRLEEAVLSAVSMQIQTIQAALRTRAHSCELLERQVRWGEWEGGREGGREGGKEGRVGGRDKEEGGRGREEDQGWERGGKEGGKAVYMYRRVRIIRPWAGHLSAC